MSSGYCGLGVGPKAVVSLMSALLVAGAAVAPACAASAGLPDDFIGVVSDDAFTNGLAYRDLTLGQERMAGVQLIRREFNWSSIETSPGRFDFSETDAEVAAAAQHGLRLLPVLFDTPDFYSSKPAHHASAGTYPPRQPGQMAGFAAAVVSRYGPSGKFWDEHPELPKLSIHHWQVWNEPNLPAYWASGPDPAQYAAMLRSVSRAIQRVEPHADVVTAGIPDSTLGIPYLQYIRGLLEHRGGVAFSTLGINPYAVDPQAIVSKLTAARALLDRFGATGARIWITELGWADGGAGHTMLRVSTGRQARLVAQALPAIAHTRRRLNVRGLIYYAWRDSAPYPPSYRDLWGLHTGLRTRADQPKPAYYAFSQAALALELG